MTSQLVPGGEIKSNEFLMLTGQNEQAERKVLFYYAYVLQYTKFFNTDVGQT